MRFRSPVHPVSALSHQEKCLIYYSRIVDLAVARGLLTADPNTEIGHFAFSPHYWQGKTIDRRLNQAVRDFGQAHPHLVTQRRFRQNEESWGAVEDYVTSDNAEKLQDLIRVGASYHVWPVGTSFTLQYPWDLEGNGRPVRFRDDLTLFSKRRILEILQKVGKLRNPHLFGELRTDREIGA